jgi:hypothetical protein
LRPDSVLWISMWVGSLWRSCALSVSHPARGRMRSERARRGDGWANQWLTWPAGALRRATRPCGRRAYRRRGGQGELCGARATAWRPPPGGRCGRSERAPKCATCDASFPSRARAAPPVPSPMRGGSPGAPRGAAPARIIRDGRRGCQARRRTAPGSRNDHWAGGPSEEGRPAGSPLVGESVKAGGPGD